MSTLQDIKFELDLMESLDNKYSTYPPGGERLDDYGDMTEIHRHQILGGTGGHIYEFKKNGYWEIHHDPTDGLVGQIKPNTNSPNPRWVATMVHLAKKRILNDGVVKIIGPSTPDVGKKHSMFDSYNAIANRIAKKEGFHVSDPHEYLHKDLGIMVKEIQLHKRAPSELAFKAQNKVMESRTEENNYVGLPYQQAVLKVLVGDDYEPDWELNNKIAKCNTIEEADEVVRNHEKHK